MKLCKDCRHIRPDWAFPADHMSHLEYAKCIHPKLSKTTGAASPITGEYKEETVHLYCSTQRVTGSVYPNAWWNPRMRGCGPRGAYWEPKPDLAA